LGYISRIASFTTELKIHLYKINTFNLETIIIIAIMMKRGKNKKR